MMEGSGRIGHRTRLHPERAGHAEMRDDRLAVIQIDQQVFGATRQRPDAAPSHMPSEIGRERKTQIVAAQLQLLQNSAFHGRREASSDGFDLW